MTTDKLSSTVLITGAAGRIGSATAYDLLASGSTVILSDIDEVRLLRLSQKLSCEFESERIIPISADLTTSSGVSSLLSNSLCKIPFINGAVHCAYPTTQSWGCTFEELDLTSLNLNLSMQLGGALLFSQAILNHFVEFHGGTLIHVSSIQGIMAPKFEHYSGTSMTSPVEYTSIKHGVIGATKWLAKYFSNKNIRVNCVSPGGILDKQDPAFLQRYRTSCCNIGMLQPHHISSVIAFLLSDAAAAITGQNVVVDDGWSL